MELRLLTDGDYAEEMDIIVNELIDQYLEGSLTAPERERFEKHFLITSRRRQKLRVAETLRRYGAAAEADEPSVTKRNYPVMARLRQLFRPPLGVAVWALILLCVGLVVWRGFFFDSDVTNGLVALNAAYRQERPVESRITGFDYAPYSNTRGSNQQKVDYRSRDRAERILLDAVNDHPDAESYHALGRLYLAEGKFDKAKDQFEEALKAEPNNAQLHSDLGAVLLESGRAGRPSDNSGKSLEDFARSLEHLNKALAINGSLLEALFNRALCYQYLMLPQQAADDWRSYLKKEPNSHWAEEARQKLKAIEEQQQKISQNKEQLFKDFLDAYRAENPERAWQAIERSSSRIGNPILERLIDRYLASAAGGLPDQAQHDLQIVSSIGEWRAQRTGDLYALTLARFYKSETPEGLSELRQARELVKTGQERIASSQFDEAFAAYTKARQIFQQAGNIPESRLAEYWLGICYLQLNDQEQSALLLRRLVLDCERGGYKWLAVRALNGLATLHYSRNEYSKAIGYGSRSLKLAEEAQDAYGLLSALSFLIETYRQLGSYGQALSYAQSALATAEIIPSETKQIWLQYGTIAWSFNSLGFHDAAAEYQKAALRLALELGEPSKISISYVRLGTIYREMQNYDEALRNVRQAVDFAATCPAGALADQMIAYTSLQLGHLFREAGNFNEAIALYDQCIKLYDKLKSPAFIYEVHKGKLLAYITKSNIAAAQSELDRVLELYEQYRPKILEENNRNSFFDVEQDVYDVAMGFQFSTINNTERAFEYSEISRARSLLDLIDQGAQATVRGHDDGLVLAEKISTPLNLRQIQERMPAQVQIIQYAALQDTLLIWVVSKTSFHSAEKRVGLAKLNELVRNYLRLISRPEDQKEETLRAATELYNILIDPISPFLDGNKQVCIVPDKILNHLPYASLVDPTSGKYLIENYLLELSPSSNIFLSSSEAAREKTGEEDERLLSVGNPRFDVEEYRAFRELPSASTEAKQIADYYPRALVLIEDQAREQRVVRGMETATVIHLALHSVINEQSPINSRLLLTKEPETLTGDRSADGVLEARELYGAKLPLARLVVLSACQTGIERSYRGEGAISIARPFIALRVPLVVASLWAVDSDSTAELMVNFHKYRKRDGLTTIMALRQAQLAMINSREPRYQRPYYWASFALIGGYVEF